MPQPFHCANGDATDQFVVKSGDDAVTLTGQLVQVGAATALANGGTDKFEGAKTLDDALRSDLGAIQNRFESAITNLQTNETNLSSARSRIEDADYATEVANMTRAQILQNVLSLLG